MKRLHESDRQKIFDYLLKEPYFNTYIIGDIEVFGLDGEYVKVFSLETEGKIECILMSYCDDFVLYNYDCNFDADKVAMFIKENEKSKDYCISGKGDAIDRLYEKMSDKKIRTTYMAHLTQLNDTSVEKTTLEVKRLTKDNSEDLLKIYLSIDEFYDKYKNYTPEQIEFSFKSGRTYGIYNDDKKLIAAASSTAESNFCCMITNVCTHPDYRKKGYAEKTIIALINSLKNDNIENICLYYDNPSAGKLYKKIGFCEKGTYKTLR